MAAMVKVVLLTLLIASSVWGRCPQESLFKPCTCEKKSVKAIVRCTGISSADELQKVFEATFDFHFDAFYLSNSYIPHLNSTWFAAKRTSKVGLFDTTLIGLFENPSNTTVPSVRHIKILNSALLKRMKWSHFKSFVRLRSLSVSGVEVKTLGRGFQANVGPELRYLTMRDTETATLEDGVFRGKRRLKLIKIREGGIKVLKNSYFEDQKKSLQYMDFSYNPIEHLPNDLFQGFERLQSVTIQGAKIKTLWKPLLDNAIKYGHIDFQGNPLECGCLMPWARIISKLPYMLRGECKSPPRFKSKRLVDLTEKDFEDLCFEEVPDA